MASVKHESSSECRALRARYVFPISGEPLAGGVLTIRGEQIVAVGTNESGRPPEDLGDAAILPGFVNAHTHLEFSALASPLAESGTPLPTWLRKLRTYRQTRGGADADIAQGLRECLASGTTAVGEIATSIPLVGIPLAGSTNASPDATVFLELIALRRDRVDERVAVAEKFLREFSVGEPSNSGFQPGGAGDARGRAGLSPHAPYTVHPQLLERCVALSNRFGVPLAMHLAESPEELELLDRGSGTLRQLLEEVNAWSPDVIGRGSRVLDYLRVLEGASRVLAIHGNYLDAEEIAFLSEHAPRMSVVFCPRTHDYFGHSPYPLARMIEAGVAMALGTDSRASNPDLSLFDEMRFVALNHPGVSPRAVLEMGTLGGARALGIAKHAGSLAAGKLANLAIVQLPRDRAEDPYELLFTNEAKVAGTWLRGGACRAG